MSENHSENAVLSYASDVVPPWWAGWLMRPLGWFYFVPLALGCAWYIWESRVLVSINAALLFALGALWFGGVGCLRMLLRAVLWKVYRRPFRQFWPGFARVGIAVGMAFLLAMLSKHEVPAHLAFRICEPTMRQAAEDIIARETAAAVPAKNTVVYPGQSFLLFRAREIRYDPKHHTVYFFIQGSGIYNRIGWAYSHDALPPQSEEEHNNQSPFEGPWYEAWAGF